MANYVGKNIPRNDGFDKATGLGVFTHDVTMPHMLFAKVLRSPHAHARVISIDTSAAEALPGVKAVCTYQNTTKKRFNASTAAMITIPCDEPVRDQLVFTDRPLYIGDEIAAVAAETGEIAAKAVKLIKVEYEILPAVYDPLEALKLDAPKVQPEFQSEMFGAPICMDDDPTQLIHPKYNNICGKVIEFGIGDIAQGFKEAEVIVEVDLQLPRVKQCQMETHAAIASYKANGILEVISTTQTPHPTKMILAYALDLPESKVRVSNPPYVGGGFGVRIGMSGKAEVIAAVLSMKALRPVKLVYTREEDFTASDTRHGGYLLCKLGAKYDGTFVAIDTTAWLNTGAYATFGVELPGVLGACGTAGAYRIPNLHYKGFPVYTNQQTAGAFRGFGTPQGTAIVEAAVDKMACALQMDPLELRKKNTSKPEDRGFFPFPIGSVGVNECIDKAAAAIGWNEKRGRNQSGHIRRGVGLAIATHVSNAAPFCVDYDSIVLWIEQDGSLHISSGIPEIGPGSTTGVIQVACDLVGVPFATTVMQFGDTASSPFDIGSHASRTIYTVSQVLAEVAPKLRQSIFEYAAAHLEVSAEQLDMVDGIISGGGKEITLKELAYQAHLNGKQFLVSGNKVPPNSLPWCAQAAEVEVDMELGLIKVLKIVAAHDVGKAVNPRLCEGQIEGAALMGVGYALKEEMVYEVGTGFYNNGLHRYMLATANDRPEIVPILVESNDPAGVFGMKGLGEVGLNAILPAIFSAVEDAVGVRFNVAPITPSRFLAGMKPFA
ncbi:MAG: molybdopterin-dependent oxidoreductase [Firmicutes bacterium]|nr:molybdopterin-dependent oxidoreductase [Bacillota bacterium]